MMKKNKRNMIYALLFCGTLGIAMTGVFVPGQLLTIQSRSGIGVAESVSEKYFSAAGSAVARNASANLSVYEKMQLISGVWESELSDAASYEMELQNFEAVVNAREAMKILYDAGFYPVDISEKYGNWYAWEAQARKAVDSTFYTYTAYFWEIRFSKYDGDEEHTVYMLEDGTVFLANANALGREEMRKIDPESTVSRLKEMGENVSPYDWERETVSDWISYVDVETENLQWKTLAQIERGEDTWFLLQAASNTQYLYAVTPQQSTGK